ncbi:SusC/RagA family TonB-linked outer membrane protein [Fulvitalea axinellae]|uniref:SusC/RagA family TonB-linked outer membrane protein n=1 Tax=Fulvitalea axinellae TaxID=1182444 RepID=A0AAU9CTK7_9BACT|nr:SusC/RagA family TonB-linked outer membrane protein [Fulvitalea axinellae]
MRQVYLLFKPFLLTALMLFMAVASYAQTRMVTGKVISAEDNEGIPGVSVVIKAKGTGVATDFDGNFKVEAQAGDVLVFSFVGFSSQEITVGSQSALTVKLESDVKALDEVVVVGYGVQKKRDVAGAIAKVDAQALTATPTPSFEQALQGKASGVQIIQGSGMAGSGSVVRIRGVASISGGGDPLYVVDGVPISQDNTAKIGFMNTNPLSTINPNDIESVEVLKDAASAAIYGARGANGVIIITTKRGKGGKPSFNYSAKVGVSKPTELPELLNGAEWLQMRQDAWENDGNTGAAPIPGKTNPNSTPEERLAAFKQAQGVDTDWLDLVTRTGFNQEHNFSGSVGTDDVQVYAGISYKNTESYIEGSGFDRFSGRVNLDWKVIDDLKIGFTSSLARSETRLVAPPWDYGWKAGLGGAMSGALPIYPVYDADGNYDISNGDNSMLINEYLNWKTVETRTINNVTFTYTPIKNLTVMAMGGFDYSRLNEQKDRPKELFAGQDNARDQYFDGKRDIYNYTGTVTASYLLELNSNHRFNFLLGAETQKQTTKYKNFSEQYVVDDATGDGQWEETGRTKAADDTWSFLSYFGRVNYTIKDRYIFQGVMRADASSKFGKNNRWGFFPSASAAWVVSEEDFLKNSDIISFLKLRSSYGRTGNSNIPYDSRFGTYYNQPGGNPGYNGDGNIITPENRSNPDLKWEVLDSYDLGLELNFFNDRVQTEVAYYYKKTSDALLKVVPAASSGQGPAYVKNIAEIENQGWEFSLKTTNIDGPFKWTTDFNIAINNNEVLDLGGISPDLIEGGTNDTRVEEGQPIGSNFLVRYVGVDPEDGLPIWLDKDGVETKEFDLDNRVFAGSVTPDFTGGITNKFMYKNFDLEVLFTFSKGGNIYGNSDKRQSSFMTDWNVRKDLADYWTGPGDTDARYPRPTLEGYEGVTDAWQYNSTMFLYDASFLRLRNVTLGYTFPASMLKRIGLGNARVYMTGVNLLTFTKYPGGDPEIARDFDNPADRNMSSNVTFLTAPQEKSFIFGVNVSF